MSTETTAGAMPVVSGATPGQSDPVEPAESTQPATGADDTLGDAGKRALEDERKARRDAEKAARELQRRLEAFETERLSESEKVVAEAKKAGATEVLAKAQGIVRRAEVRRALTAAGMNPDAIDLAATAGDFAQLEVDDDGNVSGLDQAVAEFKRSHLSLFTTTRTVGSGDTGTGGSAKAKPIYTKDQLKDTAFYAQHRADILDAIAEGRIR